MWQAIANKDAQELRRNLENGKVNSNNTCAHQRLHIGPLFFSCLFELNEITKVLVELTNEIFSDGGHSWSNSYVPRYVELFFHIYNIYIFTINIILILIIFLVVEIQVQHYTN